MRRRDFVRLVGSAAAAWPIAVRAQQASKIYRIGFLANDPAIPTQPAGQAFLDGLRESGFIEGKNIIIDRRFAQGRLDRYDKLVAELVQQEPDVLVASSNEATLAAKRSVTTIPIVMMNVSDPIGQGIIASLARPGGNITGVEQDDAAEISSKRMQLLKDAVPRATKVAVLFNPDEPYDRSQWQQLEPAARSLNLTLQQVAVRRPSEIEDAFSAIGSDRPDAILTTSDSLSFPN
jgi:putative ABC transport system substrate-binding protein